MRMKYDLDLPPECVKLLKKYHAVMEGREHTHGSKKLTMSTLVSAILAKHLVAHEEWIREQYIALNIRKHSGMLPRLLDAACSEISRAAEVSDIGRARTRRRSNTGTEQTSIAVQPDW